MAAAVGVVGATSTALAALEHDRVGEFIGLVDTTNGRDKLYRLFQGVGRFVQWYADEQLARHRKAKAAAAMASGSGSGLGRDTSASLPVDDVEAKNIAHWQDISNKAAIVQNVCGTVRKAMRLFRTLAVMRGIRTQIQNTKEWTAESLFELLARISLLAYFTIDHVALAARIKLWNPDTKVVARVNRSVEKAWLCEIIFSTLTALVRYQRLGTEKQTPQVIVARAAASRVIFRGVLDLPCALNVLGYTGRAPAGIFAAFTAITSWSNLWELWPQILVKK